MVLGPFTPGFVADQAIARQLSEIGVSLLMFGVGLHFSIHDLLAVRRIAIPGALLQIIVVTGLGALLAQTWGWSWGAGVVFGLTLSVASTVVTIRALTSRSELETVNGRVAVGWLIFEDLVMIVALVALPALALNPAPGGAAQESAAAGLWFSLLKVSAFVAAMLIVGKRILPPLLGKVARMRSRELFTLGVLAIALGIAFGASELFGVSPALGAFFAGLVISESDLSHQAGAETLPLQEAFTALFFVSVGMLFDPAVLLQNPLMVAEALALVLVAKPLATAAIVLAYRYPIASALSISASRAQIGEFSFIVIALAATLGIVPETARTIVVATAVISITANPLIYRTVSPIDRWIRRHPRLLSAFEREAAGLEVFPTEGKPGLRDHVVMVGYGRVGAAIGKALEMAGFDYLIIDQDRKVIEELRARGIPAIFGDAARPGVLSHSGVENARMLIVATPDKHQAKEVLDYVWRIRPDIDTCVRTHSLSQMHFLEELGVRHVVMGEVELALKMSDYALCSFGLEQDEVDQTIDELRAYLQTAPRGV